MKIVITGGAGFVGSNLAIKLKEKNPDYDIISFDNLRRRGSELNIKRLQQKDIKFIQGDVRNKEDFEEIESFDLMIECSAEPSVLAGSNSSLSYLINTNLLGTINCLDQVRKNNARIIFLSTSRVYPIEKINSLNFDTNETRFYVKPEQEFLGISEEGISEDFPLEGVRSFYGTTKLCSELLIKEYIDSFKIRGIINRCGVITGPWQMGKTDQGVIVLWVAKHIYNGQLSYIGYGGEGKQVRDFIHIEDLFNLIDLQIKNFDKFNNSVYNIGGGKKNSISLKELTTLCQKITGKNIHISSDPQTRKSDIKWFVTNSSKIKNLSGWEPKKGIEETVKDIAIWINSNKEQLKSILS